MGSSQNGNWITQWVTWSLSWQLSFRRNLYNAFKLSWKFLANTLHTYRDRPPPSFFHVFLRTLPFFTPSIWLSIRQTLMLVPKVSVLKRLDCKHLSPAISREKSKLPTFTIPLLSAGHCQLLLSHYRPKLGDKSFQSTSANYLIWRTASG